MESNATISRILGDLETQGWSVVPAAEIGMPREAVEACLSALWTDASDRVVETNATDAAALGMPSLGDLDSTNGAGTHPVWESKGASKVFGGLGGFTKRQFIPEQVAVQTHASVEAFYTQLFRGMRVLAEGPADHVYRTADGRWLVEADPRLALPQDHVDPLFYTYAERANLTLPRRAQQAVKQTGVKPHIDFNPWAPSNNDAGLDFDRELKAPIEMRRWEIDRPVQSFLALTSCEGGRFGGGMGCASASLGCYERLQRLPVHGRGARFGNAYRVPLNPQGDWTQSMDAETAREATALHREYLLSLTYPAYEAGDLVVWDRRTCHSGCESNDTDRLQSRVYVNKLPRCGLNDAYVAYQGEKALGSAQVHGKQRDRREVADFNLLTPYARTVLGVTGP